MRCWLLALLVTGCGFKPTLYTTDVDAQLAHDSGGHDGTVDAAPCATDPQVVLCFSFDQAPLPASLPNEGTVTSVAAQVTNVGSIARGSGNAAVMGASSEIFVPQSPATTGVMSVEIWFRLDADPVDGARAGLYDSNVGPDNMSLFVNRVGVGHTLRCGIGNETTTWNATIATANWYYAACICNGPDEQMWLDGTMVGDTPGACSNGGTIVADGLVIGANNNGGPNGVSDMLIGAIDAIRMSTVAPTPQQICVTAGLDHC